MQSILAIPASQSPTITTGASVLAGSTANLKSNRMGLVGRFAVSTTVASTVDLDFDFGEAVTADVIGVLWHNLRATDSIVVSASNVAAGNTDRLAATTFSAWSSAEKNTSAGAKAWRVLSEAVSARYWRVRLSLPTGYATGYAEVARVFIGRRQVFEVDYSALELVDDDRSVLETTDYGEDVEDVRRISFGWRARWRFGSQAEFLANHQRLVLLGKTKPIFFVPIPDATNAQDLAAFGFMKNPAKASSQKYDIWEMGFDVISLAA